MARIEDQYELKVNSGGLDTLIKQGEKTVQTANQMNAALNRFPVITGKVSGATRELVGDLEVFQREAATAFTKGQQDTAMERLIRQMDRVGLAFRTEAAEAQKAALLTEYSLKDLAESGQIAANKIAESAYGERMRKEADKAAAAQEKAAAAAEKAAQRAAAAQAKADAQLQRAAERAQERIERMAQREAARQEREAQKLVRLQEKAEREAERLAKKEADAKIREEQRAAREAERLMAKEAREEERAARERERFWEKHNQVNAVTGRLVRMAATLFTARKLMQYIRDAIERAPEERAAPFVGLKSDISDAGARAVVALMNGMADGVDRLRKSMASTGGQKFFRAMERSAAAAGRVVGRALALIGSGIEWVGDNAEAVFSALAIVVGLFSVRMLGAAAAVAAANAPLVLTIGLITLLISGLNQAGVTAGDIFGGIAELAGGLYAFGYNLVADGYNLIASFAEFFLNVWKDPVNAVGNLFFDLFDFALSLLETVGGAVDAIAAKFHHKWNVAGEIAGLRQVLREEQAEKFSPNRITLDRMEHIDLGAVMEEWGRLGAGFGDSLSGFNLAEALAEPLRDIGSDVADIRRSVSLTAEDLKSLVDVAERRYVNHISLTSQTPVITVNGANTGRTAEDRQALADAIAEVLIEQTASGATVDTRTPA